MSVFWSALFCKQTEYIIPEATAGISTFGFKFAFKIFWVGRVFASLHLSSKKKISS